MDWLFFARLLECLRPNYLRANRSRLILSHGRRRATSMTFQHERRIPILLHSEAAIPP